MSGSASSPMRGDREAHRARPGIRHQLEAAPAAHRIGEHHVELVRRLVDERLADPRGDDEERLERLHRQGLDHERRHVVLDALTATPVPLGSAAPWARCGRRRRRDDGDGGAAIAPTRGDVTQHHLRRLVEALHRPAVATHVGVYLLGQTSPRPVHGVGAGVAVDPEQLAGFGGSTSPDQCDAAHSALVYLRRPTWNARRTASPSSPVGGWHGSRLVIGVLIGGGMLRPIHPRARPDRGRRAGHPGQRAQPVRDRTASASRRACRTSASWSRPRTATLVAEAHDRRRRALPHPDRRAGHLRRPPRPGHAARRADRRRGQGLASRSSSPPTTPRPSVLPGRGPPHHRGQVEPAAPGPRQRVQAGDDHRHHVDRAVADLRHDRSVELRPRRDGHVRRGRWPGASTGAGPRGRSSWRRSIGNGGLRPRSAALFELASVAAAASARHRPDVDDDRVDRRGARRSATSSCSASAATSSSTASTRAARPGEHRADRPRAALAVDHGASRASSSSAWRCSSCARPLRQGDPGRVRQPRPGVVERHRHRPGHPASCGSSAARLAGLGGVLLRPRVRQSAGTWASRCCC